MTTAAEIQLSPEEREHNAHRNFDDRRHVDECFICGRGITRSGLTNAFWIEMLVTGEIVGPDDPRSGGPESQGCFPVGSTCVQRVPANLRHPNPFQVGDH